MNFDDFSSSLAAPTPPDNLPVLLKALWHDGKGEWEQAHEIAQSREGDPAFDRIHAYLHRVEGDEWNANYWYRRAGMAMFKGSLKDEWNALVLHHLG